MKKAIVLMFDNVEELEAIAPIDILRRAGADVITASLENSKNVKGRSAIKIECDSLFADEQQNNFDIVVVAGGPGTNNVIKNTDVLKFVARHNNQKACIGAICAAPVVLKAAGILDDKKCTAHTSRVNELENCLENESVVVDDNIITSRGAGTAIEFALALVEKNFSKEIFKEVSTSICYQNN